MQEITVTFTETESQLLILAISEIKKVWDKGNNSPEVSDAYASIIWKVENSK